MAQLPGDVAVDTTPEDAFRIIWRALHDYTRPGAQMSQAEWDAATALRDQFRFAVQEEATMAVVTPDGAALYIGLSQD